MSHCSGVRSIASTQRWLERAVIGLNLCPFAKAVHEFGHGLVANWSPSYDRLCIGYQSWNADTPLHKAMSENG